MRLREGFTLKGLTVKGAKMKCDLCDEESDEVERVLYHSELAAGAYCPACLRGALPAESVGPEGEEGAKG